MRNPFVKKKIDPHEFKTCPGDPVKIVYDTKVESDGTIVLKPSAKIDLKAQINSFRESTDISFIIARMKAGDTEAANVVEGYYGDFTKFPKTYAEMLQLYIDAENKFNLLPLDVRNQFDNDYKKWLVGAGSDNWLEKMASVLPKSETVDPLSVDPEPTEKE